MQLPAQPGPAPHRRSLGHQGADDPVSDAPRQGEQGVLGGVTGRFPVQGLRHSAVSAPTNSRWSDRSRGKGQADAPPDPRPALAPPFFEFDRMVREQYGPMFPNVPTVFPGDLREEGPPPDELTGGYLTGRHVRSLPTGVGTGLARTLAIVGTIHGTNQTPHRGRSAPHKPFDSCRHHASAGGLGGTGGLFPVLFSPTPACPRIVVGPNRGCWLRGMPERSDPGRTWPGTTRWSPTSGFRSPARPLRGILPSPPRPTGAGPMW